MSSARAEKHEIIAKDIKDRERAVKRWRGRLAALKKRGVSIGVFCASHGICHFQLSHYVGGRRLPSWDRIFKINTALESEGV